MPQHWRGINLKRYLTSRSLNFLSLCFLSSEMVCAFLSESRFRIRFLRCIYLVGFNFFFSQLPRVVCFCQNQVSEFVFEILLILVFISIFSCDWDLLFSVRVRSLEFVSQKWFITISVTVSGSWKYGFPGFRFYFCIFLLA